MIGLIEHFKSEDRSRHSDWLRQQRWFIKARQDRQQRQEVEDKLEDDIISLATGVIAATEIEIAAFEAKLDSYDTATVQALMFNQEQLDAVNARILDMLDRAYVMEDGRRAFKTEDGTQVFDEFGTEVESNEIDFD